MMKDERVVEGPRGIPISLKSFLVRSKKLGPEILSLLKITMSSLFKL